MPPRCAAVGNPARLIGHSGSFDLIIGKWKTIPDVRLRSKHLNRNPAEWNPTELVEETNN
jgi:hypothetical protein